MKKLIYIVVLLHFCIGNCFADAKPLRIVLVAPFNGPYSALGSQLLSGASQAVADINKNGGVNGIPLEIMPLDDQCDPELAVARAGEIIHSNQYDVVIGHTCSAAALATANLYADENILVISPTATNPKITERGVNTLFRMSGNDKAQASTAANFIAQKLQSKRIAILHDEELYSKGLADLVSERLTYLKTSPAMYQAIPRGSRQFTTLIKKIKNLDIDAIYFAGLYPEVASLSKALNTLELQIPIISGDGIALEKFVDDMETMQAASSVLFTFGNDPQNFLSSRQAIHDMKQNNLPTNGYALYAYAAVQVFAEAVAHTNELDGKTLANWLHYNSVDTVLGKKSWDTNGDIIDGEFNMYAWKKNKDQIHLAKILK